MSQSPNTVPEIAQSPSEAAAFVEAFAKLTVSAIMRGLGSPLAEIAAAEQASKPDWDDVAKLALSGIAPDAVDQKARDGEKYLHLDAALISQAAREGFLALSGLSAKQRRVIFPVLSARPPYDIVGLAENVSKLNRWLDEIRAKEFDPAMFVTYQRALTIHGSGQNLSGAVGAAGAVIAFRDALEELKPGIIVDTVGTLPPKHPLSPSDLHDWMLATPPAQRTVKAILLENGRALVFASSKDANIFQPLGKEFASAKDVLARFNKVRNNQKARSQTLHEFAVGEVKTATDAANLHERMGLASRETQTELRTDRFLMMALLNTEILSGGVQGRTLNNRDIVRFTDVFNLHHCWGWDGGRARHPSHWANFKEKVAEWCLGSDPEI